MQAEDSIWLLTRAGAALTPCGFGPFLGLSRTRGWAERRKLDVLPPGWDGFTENCESWLAHDASACGQPRNEATESRAAAEELI